MPRFEVNILGCSAAAPTSQHYPTSQVVNVRDKLFMIDCGEGAQINFRRSHLAYNRLGHIFLSHLHGDHCFGLPGLISTMALQGCNGEVVIHAHPDAERVFTPMLDYFCSDIPLQVRFNAISPQSHEVIYSDKSVTVRTIPMKHRVPCCGFLFEEAEGERHLRGDMIDFYQIPVYRRKEIKSGADYITPDGKVLPNELLTLPPTPAVRYAYCSDTVYNERIIPYIEGVDLLYHEATYASECEALARTRYHSTARQAAKIAQLARAKELIIGHYSSRYADEHVLLCEAQEVFANTRLVYEGMKCILNK